MSGHSGGSKTDTQNPHTNHPRSSGQAAPWKGLGFPAIRFSIPHSLFNAISQCRVTRSTLRTSSGMRVMQSSLQKRPQSLLPVASLTASCRSLPYRSRYAAFTSAKWCRSQ